MDSLTLTHVTPKKEEKAWREPFLAALSEHGSITLAARAARVSRFTVYRERNQDELFRKQWDYALELGVDALEDMAKIRAQTSDTLMIFLLKAHRPEKYRERAEIKHTFDPINWDTVPPDVRDAFISGRITLDDVQRVVSGTH